MTSDFLLISVYLPVTCAVLPGKNKEINKQSDFNCWLNLSCTIPGRVRFQIVLKEYGFPDMERFPTDSPKFSTDSLKIISSLTIE